jgi:DNA-directed RNA polymerase specialized sigma24 family protein
MTGQHELDAAILAVFILAELEEMSPKEISEALEIPLSIAYSSMRTRRSNERVSYRERGDRAR